MGCLMGISIQRKRQTGNPDFSSGQRNIGRFIFQKMDTCRCQFLPIIIQHIPVLFHLAFQPLLMIAQGIIYLSDLRKPTDKIQGVLRRSILFPDQHIPAD